MARETWVEKLLWIPGSSSGHSGPLNELRRGARGITPGEEQVHSVVIIDGQPEDYTDEELEKLAAFAERALVRHDENWKHRNTANFIIFRKEAGTSLGWLRKLSSWWSGALFSPTLDEAIAFMDEATPIGCH